MDNHERGWEKKPGRPDLPLPEWNGSYGGDSRRLPRVVQKLQQKRKLTAEEKAELLWRFYELDQVDRRKTQARVATMLVVLVLLTAGAVWLYFNPQPWIADRLLEIVDPGAAAST
jgi:hypothetical protein